MWCVHDNNTWVCIYLQKNIHITTKSFNKIIHTCTYVWRELDLTFFVCYLADKIPNIEKDRRILTCSTICWSSFTREATRCHSLNVTYVDNNITCKIPDLLYCRWVGLTAELTMWNSLKRYEIYHLPAMISREWLPISGLYLNKSLHQWSMSFQ